MKKVYLDNGSTSFPKAPRVGKVMQQFLETGGYNIARGGYQDSYSLAERVFETRTKLKDFFCCDKESNVVFTPNITYSLNIIITGLLKPGDHVIITSMEHNAVARPIEAVRRNGVKVSTAPCDDKGRLDVQALEACITSETKAVVMLHGSNVCGTLMPLQRVGDICKRHNIYFIVDGAQTAGIFPLDIKAMKIDALAFTGHKGMLGPQGIGGFLINEGLAEQLSPMVFGGTGSISDSVNMPDFLPDKFEAGTLNIPGILGLSTALDYINRVGIDRIAKKELSLTMAFIENLKGKDDIKLIGLDSDKNRCPIVSVDFIGRDNGEIAYRLDSEFGIMTRCGLHCAPLAHKTLKTFPRGTVRFAFGHTNSYEEVEYAVEAIKQILVTYGTR